MDLIDGPLDISCHGSGHRLQCDPVVGAYLDVACDHGACLATSGGVDRVAVFRQVRRLLRAGLCSLMRYRDGVKEVGGVGWGR